MFVQNIKNMSNWINIGVSNPEDIENTIKALEKNGFRITERNSNSLKATSLNTDKEVEYSDVISIIKRNKGFSGSKVCTVIANDEEEIAGGTVYDIENGSIEKIKSKDCGGPEKRKSWDGISVGEIRIDGKKSD